MVSIYLKKKITNFKVWKKNEYIELPVEVLEIDYATFGLSNQTNITKLIFSSQFPEPPYEFPPNLIKLVYTGPFKIQTGLM